MRPLHLIASFMRSSIQQELAYRANFAINLLHSLLNLGVSVIGLSVLFGQVESLRGWDFPSALALVGVYLVVGAIRGLFIGPGLEALAGLGQEIWSGAFDFVLIRPVNTQFLVTFRIWRLFSLVDLALGAGVIVAAVSSAARPPELPQLLAFGAALLAAVVVLYALLLAFTALVFWNPAFLFTWVFDGIFQLARYPVGIYPGWLRVLLTWVLPVGLMTTVPAQALMGQAGWNVAAGSAAVAGILLVAASAFFHAGLKRYASASS